MSASGGAGEYCVDYVAGFTTEESVSNCGSSGFNGTWSNTMPCRPGRVAHCTFALTNGSGRTFVMSFYAPWTLTEAANFCTPSLLGNMGTADFASN
jgi:hypothetical protein